LSAAALDALAARWLRGGHLQTIWPALWSHRLSGPALRFERERWNTPDGDFIDVDFLAAAGGHPGPASTAISPPLLVLFHGLEGSSASHYAQAFGSLAQACGWRFAVPHFRGCSGELNLAPRAYHSGDYEEIGWVLQRLRARAPAPMPVVGVSLGGNALLRWAQEAGSSAARTAAAVAALSSPIDLAAGGHAIGRGFNRQVYTRMFLRTMKPKAMRKLAQFPGLFDARRLQSARTLYEFDNVFTAPLHGFSSTEDYWARASAKPQLSRCAVPALVLNALNDPFVPAHCLPLAHEVGPNVTLWQPRHGGHVGFAQGAWPGHVLGLPKAVLGWLRERLPSVQSVA
jgi:predicted alpha/beta-fold hydrolase